jgi:hypothetical protein
MYLFFEFSEKSGLAELDVDADAHGEARYYPVLRREIHNWCNQNLRDGYELEHENHYWSFDEFTTRYFIFFNREVDAIMFKMKWL